MNFRKSFLAESEVGQLSNVRLSRSQRTGRDVSRAGEQIMMEYNVSEPRAFGEQSKAEQEGHIHKKIHELNPNQSPKNLGKIASNVLILSSAYSQCRSMQSLHTFSTLVSIMLTNTFIIHPPTLTSQPVVPSTRDPPCVTAFVVRVLLSTAYIARAQ